MTYSIRPHYMFSRNMYLKEVTINEISGTLRSPTATSTKMSSQNTTLLYHKSFVIIPSCLRHILLAKYPENELVRETLR